MNQTKKKIEEWLFKLAELMQNDNNYDNSLDETNQYFAERCGKVYEPVSYGFNYFNCCKGKITIYSGSENYMTYKVCYNCGDDKEIWLYTHPQKFYKFDKERCIVKITPIHETVEAVKNGYEIVHTFDVYEKYEKPLVAAGWDVIVFVPSLEEDEDRITCGNSLIALENSKKKEN